MAQIRDRFSGLLVCCLIFGAGLAGLIFAAGLIFGAGSPVQADAGSGLRVEGVFARATPGLARNGVVFMAIHNPGDRADRLIAIRTDIAARAELHTHLHADGVMRMRPVTAIEIPAQGMAKLAPGGDHVMLLGLKAPLKEGARFPITLVFETSDPVAVTVHTLSVGAQKMEPHHKHH